MIIMTSRRAVWLLRASFPQRQTLVDKRHDATTSNRSPHERIELLVASNRKLQVSWRNAFHTKILRRIAYSPPRKKMHKQKQKAISNPIKQRLWVV
jgi:hypothetical protein